MAAKRAKPGSRKPASGKKRPSSGRGPATGRGGAASRRPAVEGDRDVERIQRFIDVMTAAGAVELEMQDGEQRLRIRLRDDRPTVSYAAPPPVTGSMPLEHAAPSAPNTAGEAAATETRGEVFKSPMVGTFYRQSSPDSDPFVKVGDRITADRTLCIIEAMKVMNEIKAEIEGEIVEILAQNGQPVEFGQPLFVIKRL